MPPFSGTTVFMLRTFSFLALAALVVSPVFGQATWGDVSGRITQSENGEPVPYRRRVALYAAEDATGRAAARTSSRGSGVKIAAIVEDPAPFGKRWAPNDPFAYQEGPNKGYVPLSNVYYTTEMVNAMTAQRAYEANVSVIEMFKSMAASTLRLIA